MEHHAEDGASAHHMSPPGAAVIGESSF